MIKGQWINARLKAVLLFVPLMAALMAACVSDDEEYDPYYDWEKRNVAWYEQIADSARTAIRAARAAHGDEWEEYCDWRMYKSLQKSPRHQSGELSDSICVHILERGTGSVSPTFNDTVRISFRGWLMPTTNEDGSRLETVFTQTYYGDFDAKTAAPNLAPPSTYQEGVATAMQYMVEDDDWMVYIPQQLFYGSELAGAVQPYSTVRMRIHLAAVYPQGTAIPDWK